MRGLGVAIAVLAGAVLLGCGRPRAVEQGPTVDADPLTLLPAGAFLVANVDARALLTSATLGPSAATIGTALLPLGDDAGFDAARDVDRIVVGEYGGSPVEVAV